MKQEMQSITPRNANIDIWVWYMADMSCRRVEQQERTKNDARKQSRFLKTEGKKYYLNKEDKDQAQRKSTNTVNGENG